MIHLYIDCHAHLFFNPIPSDTISEDIIGDVPYPNLDFLSKSISDARNEGVRYIVGVISNPNLFLHYEDQIKLENIIHIIGISRNNALEDHDTILLQLKEEIERKKPHGIGEIGLDYPFGFNNLNENMKRLIIKKQKDLFRKQIILSKEFNLPIVLHAGYRTDEDIIKILKQERVQDIGVQVHGYMSNQQLVFELLDMGFYMSFGYVHLQEEEFKKIIEMTPLEQILTETDSPYHLMDNPKKFILPEDIVSVTKEIASIKKVDSKVLANQVLKNAQKLFKF